MMLAPAPLLAALHGGAAFSWTHGEAHPSVLAGCGLLLAAYLAGIGPLRRRYALGDAVGPGRVACFLLGLLTMLLALNGPIHDLSDNFLFSAHMVQHLLLMLIMPPLLLLGTPGWLLRPLLRPAAVMRALRLATRPLAAFAIYNVVFIAWHLPRFYNAALEHHDLHIVQHLMFMAAAVLMWWPVVTPLPELGRLAGPLQMLYLFAFGVPMSIVSALITLSERVLYPFYERAPRVFALSALDDQQLGGLIMWVPGGLIFWVAITVVFFRWARGEEQEEAQQRLMLAAASH
ncbi:MAG: cytochrome c oxidase assembly protein [Gemmatimonadetes bacterium]|nr:cytochrome c oxidase assembly protein [Gemmatimonadota bacterium]